MFVNLETNTQCDGKPGVFGNASEAAIGTVGGHTIGVRPSGVLQRMD